jgi:hypothetical protein
MIWLQPYHITSHHIISYNKTEHNHACKRVEQGAGDIVVVLRPRLWYGRDLGLFDRLLVPYSADSIRLDGIPLYNGKQTHCSSFLYE